MLINTQGTLVSFLKACAGVFPHTFVFNQPPFLMNTIKLTMAIVATAALVACGKTEAPVAAPAAPVVLPELKVAIDPTYEPFTFKTPDGKPTGFDVDIAEALCAEIKRKCVYVEQVWDGMIPGLQAKKYDVIISSMSITDERRKSIDFSVSYRVSVGQFVGPKGKMQKLFKFVRKP